MLSRRAMKPNDLLIGVLLLFLLSDGLGNAAVSRAADPEEGPLEPDAALRAFRLEPGLQIELAAAEPLVVDPVAIAFDERGRMYVAENRGYPTGPRAGAPPIGTIALLEDSDADGRFDKRTTFAGGLTFPNGLMPWKDGVIVTCAPDIIHLRDTNGDGKADVRQVLFTGFDASNTSQLRVSHPTFGLDNWIYVTSGLTGGKITSPDHPDRAPLEVRTDFRFHPLTGEYEPADGRGQFGMSFDDFGHRFVCYNRVHIQHVVLPSRYLRRNPHLAFSDTMQNVPESMAPEPLRGHGTAARIFPISKNVTTADSHAGTFTAACGLLIYRGTALPAEYHGNAMACEPTGNLVHRDHLIASGATFIARRARDGVEMVASTDNWFRPVNLALGPDGALYICDMYRKTIEHPQYLPEEIRKRTDFSSGNDRGRIYRVRALEPSNPNAAPRQTRSDAANASIDQLCRMLGDPNAFWRETAQRLLVERQDRSAVSRLEQQLKNRHSEPAVARLHAFRTLDALGGISDEILELALTDPLPAVREHALQMVEPRLRSGSQAEQWRERVRRLASDADARVRFQCALALGESEVVDAGALVQIALQGASDRWTRAAVLSSATPPQRFFRKLLVQLHANPTRWIPDVNAADIGALLFDTSGVMGRALGAEEIAEVIRPMLSQEQKLPQQLQWSVLNGAAAGMGRGSGPSTEIDIQQFGTDDEARLQIKALLSEALKTAMDSDSELPRRLTALSFLQFADFEPAGEELLKLLGPGNPTELQTAVVRSVVMMRHSPDGAMLLDPGKWQRYTPPVQETVIGALLSSERHVRRVLEAVGQGSIPHWAVPVAQRNRLLKSKDEHVRKQAEALFRNRGGTDRMNVFETLKSVLKLPPNARNGQEMFRRHCANCHRLDQEGTAVGPDLFSIRNQPKEAILLHTIVPEHEIVPGFGAYTVETKDGRTLSGLIISETASSLTLRGALGTEETLLRREIESIVASELSLMPQGFETAMTVQELADLIAYLKGE